MKISALWPLPFLAIFLASSPVKTSFADDSETIDTQSEEYKEFKEYQRFKEMKRKNSQQQQGDSSLPAPKPTPLTPEEESILARGEVADGPYIGGGVVGTVFGLGIGQAIQGRYAEKGWIFTVGEIVSAGLLVAGEADCVAEALGDGIVPPTQCNTTLIGLGAAGLLAFRIWEIIDVWAVPPVHNQEYRRVREIAGPQAGTFSFYVAPAVRESEVKAGIGFFF